MTTCRSCNRAASGCEALADTTGRKCCPTCDHEPPAPPAPPDAGRIAYAQGRLDTLLAQLREQHPDAPAHAIAAAAAERVPANRRKDVLYLLLLRTLEPKDNA